MSSASNNQDTLAPALATIVAPLLNISQVGIKLGGLNRSRIYSLMRDEGFPRPLKLGAKSVRWRVADVDRWLHQQAVAQGLEAA
jgi:predicted DNA-binding transcriptional regulator AlpA